MTIVRLLGRSVALAMVVASTTATSAQTPAPGGRTLEDALRELQAQGLRIVYSSELVRPDMRVAVEPRSDKPRERLDALLRPHGLEARSGPGGTLRIVRARRPPPRVSTTDLASTGSVAGQVVDARTGTPLAGVMVAAQATEDRTVTGEDGAFEIRGLASGPQSLFVSLVGYSLARPLVDVRAGAVVRVTVPLADGTTTYTEKVTVTGDPFRGADPTTPVGRSLTSAELHKLRGVLTDDPFRAVQSLPGVTTNNDLRSEFSVRGSDFRHMGLSIDGLPTSWLVHNVHNYENKGSIAMLNADVIDSAAMSVGAQPQNHPGRTGAWLDFRIREGSRIATQIHGAVSMASASVVADGPLGANRRGSWLVSARQSYVQWLIHRIQIDSTAFGFTDALSKVVFDVTPEQQLQFGVVAGRSRLDQAASATGSNELGVGTRVTGVAWAAWRSTLGPTVVIDQRVGLVTSDFENTRDSGLPLASGVATEASYAPKLTWAATPAALVRVGGLVQRQRVNQDDRSLLASTTGARDRSHNEHVEGSQLISSMDAGIEWSDRRGHTFGGGARVSYSTLIDDATVSPWLVGSLRLGERFALRAGVSAPRQLPDLDQAVGTFGRPNVRPERARALDLSLEIRQTEQTRWQVLFYDRRERDLLRLEDSETRLDPNGQVRFASALTPTWFNALSGGARGVEILVQRRGLNGVGGWIGYTYGQAEYRDSLRTETFWSDLDQRHALNAFVEGRLSPKTSVSAKLRMASGLPLPGYFEERSDGLFAGARRNTIRLPSYARLDLRADRAFNYRRSRLTLFAEVVNVLNRSNIAPGYGGFVVGGRAFNFTSEQFPILPAVGILVEF